MASSFRIGLDLDGVVADWTGAAKRWFNARGYKFDETQDVPTWNYIEDNVSKEDWKAIWKEAENGFFLEKVQALRGADEFVAGLAKLGDIVVITSRPKVAALDTFAWIHRRGWDVTGINVVGKNDPKWLISADVLIDDKPEHVAAWLDKPNLGKAVLFSRDYNMMPEGPQDSTWKIIQRGYDTECYTRGVGYEHTLGWVERMAA